MKSLTVIKTALVALSIVVMSACQRPSANVGPQQAVRQVTDDLGRTVTVPVKITRTVSLAPNLTESIFAIGAGDRLVGVTTFCNYPAEAKSIAKVGDTMNPNIESIVALKPDVVLVSTASQIEAFTKTLEGNGIAVYVTNSDSFDSIFRNLKQLGELFETQNVASNVVDELEKRAGRIWDNAQRENASRVFIQISREPLFTIGKQSFLNTVIVLSGGESVTATVETAYPKLSKETASALNPEVIILSESEDNGEPNEVFKNSPAVKNGRVYKINADILSRPGPRLVDALEQIAGFLHQEKFRNK